MSEPTVSPARPVWVAALRPRLVMTSAELIDGLHAIADVIAWSRQDWASAPLLAMTAGRSG